MKGALPPESQQLLLDLFASDAWVSEGGNILLSNGFLRDRARDSCGWDDPAGHAFWELFEGQGAEGARSAYDAWRASGTGTGHVLVSGSAITRPMGNAEIHLFNMGPFELGVMFVPHSQSGADRIRKLDTHLRIFQSYISQARIGMVIFEEVAPRVATVRQVNDEAAEIFELSPQELIGRNLLELVRPDEQERNVGLYLSWQRGETDLPFLEVGVTTGSGETLTVEAVLGGITWDGRPAGFVMFRDVTERAVIFAELRRYAQAFELINDTVVLADGNFNVIYVNPAGLERSGHPIDDVVGKFVGVFGAMRPTEQDIDGIKRTLMRDGTWRGERWAQRIDGTEYPVDLVVSLQRDPGGKPQMVTIVSRDISAQKANERSLRRARERAEFFTDLMSHDINNYIQGVLGRLELLATSDLDEGQRAHVRQAMDQATRTSELVARVRAVSQAQHAGALKPVDLRATISECLEDLRLKWRSKPFEVRAAHAPEPATVMADDLLRDLVINLLDNAIKHSPQREPLLEIATRPHREDRTRLWRLEVADHGPGVPDAQKQEVFYRFVRRGSGEGKGLGLSLVMALAERYNGRAWVEDRVPGDHTQGARFVVELPAA